MLAEALLSSFRQVEPFFPFPPHLFPPPVGAQGSQSGSRCSSGEQPLVALHVSAITACPLGAPQLRPEARAARALPWWWEEVWPSGNTEGAAGILCRSLWSHSAGERSAQWARRGYKTPDAFCWLSPPPPPQHLCSNLDRASDAPFSQGKVQGWVGRTGCLGSTRYKQTPGQVPAYLIGKRHQAPMEKELLGHLTCGLPENQGVQLDRAHGRTQLCPQPPGSMVAPPGPRL